MIFKVYDINVSADDLEQLGTKEKFWFFTASDKSKKWLFKYSRLNTGEHWSEKIAEQLCKELMIPHVRYHLAGANKRLGIVTPNAVPDDCRMVMGNEVLHKDSPSNYPKPIADNERYVRVKEHTVSRVLGCLDLSDISPPVSEYDVADLNAGDVFCGYLLLDALISNQDRHHENWAIIINNNTGEKSLCPTYDHAASLGRELLDKEREERLKTKDVQRKVPTFVRKAKSELFKLKTDKKPLSTVEAFFLAVEKRNLAKKHWLSKLKDLTEDSIRDIFSRIPEQIFTDLAREFAIQMVLENKKRLLEDDRA